MKGIDLLAAQCKPAEAPEASGSPAAVTLTDEQCQQIAQTVIGMLQNGLPAPKKEAGPAADPAQEDPDLSDEGGEEDGIEEGL